MSRLNKTTFDKYFGRIKKLETNDIKKMNAAQRIATWMHWQSCFEEHCPWAYQGWEHSMRAMYLSKAKRLLCGFKEEEVYRFLNLLYEKKD